MEPKIIHAGSYGVALKFKVAPEILDASTLRLRVRNPQKGNSDYKLEGITLEDITEGVVRYITKERDFKVPGQYRLQIFQEDETKKVPVTDVFFLKVKSSLDFIEQRK